MTDQPTYPYQDGDVTVLGPEIFASKGGAVISWRGENYIRQQDIPPRGDEMLVDALHELASGVRDLASAVRLENADQTRKAEREAADTVAAAALMVNLVRERAERAEAELRDRVHADSADAAAGSYAHRAEQAEAVIARVGKLADELFVAGRTQSERDTGRRLLAALQPPTPAHDAGRGTAQQPAALVRPADATVDPAMCPRCKGDNQEVFELCTTCAQATQRPKPAHDAGPTVRECADNDKRWWNGEKAGE